MNEDNNNDIHNNNNERSNNKGLSSSLGSNSPTAIPIINNNRSHHHNKKKKNNHHQKPNNLANEFKKRHSFSLISIDNNNPSTPLNIPPSPLSSHTIPFYLGHSPPNSSLPSSSTTIIPSANVIPSTTTQEEDSHNLPMDTIFDYGMSPTKRQLQNNHLDDVFDNLKEEEEKQPYNKLSNDNISDFSKLSNSIDEAFKNTIKEEEEEEKLVHNENDKNNNKEKEEANNIISSSDEPFPDLNTNIKDILKGKVSFEEYGKRFIVVGLEYECHRFESINELFKHISSENVDNESFWIDCQQCSPNEIHELQKYFDFHPLTTEDCITNDSGEKWEIFDNYMFLVFTGQVADKVSAVQNEYLPCFLNILIFDNFILTIHDKPIEGLDLLMKRIERDFEMEYRLSRFAKQRLNTSLSNVGLRGDSNNNNNNEWPTVGVIGDSSISLHKYDMKRSLSKLNLETSTSIEPLAPNDVLIDIDSNNNNNNTTPLSPTTTTNKPSSGRVFSPITRKIDDNIRKSTVIPSPSWVFYAYLDAIIDMYIPKVDALVRECDTLDEFTISLNTTEKEDLLWRISMNKRKTIVLRKLLLPKQKMITYLVSPRVVLPFIEQNVQIYLRDVLDHLTYCCDRLEMARDSLNQCHSNYLTRVQIEIAQNSQKTDAFMNRITVFASIFGPLSVISGIWGMNVKVPGQADVENNLYWFFGICGFMVVLSLVLIILLRKQLIKMN
ncbi:hypothetical protein ABK040_000050 [Willaertia magna]